MALPLIDKALFYQLLYAGTLLTGIQLMWDGLARCYIFNSC